MLMPPMVNEAGTARVARTLLSFACAPESSELSQNFLTPVILLRSGIPAHAQLCLELLMRTIRQILLTK